MIVFVNAISITQGGSLVVLSRLLGQLMQLRCDIAWHVAVCKRLPALEALNSNRLTTWTIPWAGRSPLHIKFWYERKLPRLVGKVGADILLSLTNYLPRRSIPIPSLLLVQHAGHFSAAFKVLTEQCYPGLLARWAWRAKSRWVRESVRRASFVTVQTHALARAVVEGTGVPRERIVVVPHGQGLNRTGRPRKYPASRCWHVGYVTKFGVQKNFRVLFQAVSALVAGGHDIRLVLTLRQDLPEYQRVAGDLRDAGIEAWVENHGEVEQEQVETVYDALDLFVFPSMCESFGFPMVEAMACGLPIVVADTEGNREVTGSAGRFFSAHDHLELANRMLELMGSSEAYESASRASLKRAGEFSWRMAAEETLAALERACGQARSGSGLAKLTDIRSDR